MNTRGLVKVRIDDLPVGAPIVWTLFDEDGDVAYRPGHVFRTRQELAGLLRMTELFRADGRNGSVEAPAAASKRTPVSGNDVETRLDEISLHIGEAWQLQPVPDFDQQRHYVKLVGYLTGVSVIVTNPAAEGRALLVRDAQQFIVRAFSGKSAYAFKTAVLKSVGTPFPHLHLAYPESVRGMIVRQDQRITVNIITAVVPQKAGLEKAPGVIRNVSKSGASLQARAPIGGSGDHLTASFKLEIEGNDHLLTLEGIIRAVRPGATPADPVEYGIQFLNPKPIEQLVLTAYVNALIANSDIG